MSTQPPQPTVFASDTFDPLGLFTEPATAAAPSVSIINTVPGTGHRHRIKQKGDISNTTKKILKLTTEHGCEVKDAMELVLDKEPTVAQLRYMQTKVAKHSITTPDMQKLARSVIKDTLKGKPMVCERTTIDRKTGQVIDYTDNQYPSHTNMLAAASMVQDRVDPIVRQNINLNGNLADFLPFELDKYR